MQDEDSKIEESKVLDCLYSLLSLRTWLESYMEFRDEGNLVTMRSIMDNLIKELDDGTEDE